MANQDNCNRLTKTLLQIVTVFRITITKIFTPLYMKFRHTQQIIVLKPSFYFFYLTGLHKKIINN